MNIAKVTSITPTGDDPYQSQNGLLYSFIIGFSDGATGRANALNPTGPAYGIGESVGYEFTGKKFNNVPIIKVNKKTGQQAPAPQAPIPGLPNAAPVANQRPAGEAAAPQPVFGATVGMSINLTFNALIQDLSPDEIRENMAEVSFWQAVYEGASDIIRISRTLEAGKLAPSIRERTLTPEEKAEAEKEAAFKAQVERERKEAEEKARLAAAQKAAIDGDEEDRPF